MVIVSHPTGNTFSTEVANALYEAGLLSAFYSCVVWNPKSPMAQLIPKGLRTQLERRARIDLPPELVHTRPFRDMVRNILIRAGRKQWLAGESNPFSTQGVYKDMDRHIAVEMHRYAGAHAVYAYEDGALRQFQRARELGLHTLYDLPIGYWRANRKISKEEAELQPAWSGTLNALTDSDEKCGQKDRELALADTVIVPSTFVKDTLEFYPETKKIVVNPFGVPQNIASPRGKTDPNQPLRVLFVGSLSQRKGIAYLFEAVEKAGTAVTLTVIGRKVGHSPLLDKRCEEHRWLSSLPHAEILAEMRRHDVFVFPSLFEGLALVQGEALSQGLPVITTPNSGGTDILRDGVDGFIVPIRNSDAIAEHLLQLHGDRTLLQQMSTSALERATQLTWEGYKARTVSLVRDALQSS